MSRAIPLPLVRVAPGAAVLFVGGFFMLAARDAAVSPGVYALIALGAALLACAVLLFTALVAAVESLSGRAWAGGFRRLASDERDRNGWVRRALRYAAFLWFANGAAFVVAALL